ncbi:hypothetical protein [Aestuariibacter salexigens]|uniref:hypothetical protein n=1 Tax=Aestuariibacter salexigens TaxID=226010 RepID=UPI00047A56E6|nr:hypothetical protein [Aestuariibacter salexigens]
MTDALNEKPKRLIWVWLTGCMALVVIASMFSSDVAHSAAAPLSSIYSIMLWMGLFCWTLFRYLGKSGGIGFAVGSAIGITVFILAPLFVV